MRAEGRRAMNQLSGIRILNLSINLPGPLAAARLAQFGAEVVKIEPPSGDPLALACRPYYDRLTSGQRILTLDLKNAPERAELDAHLATADLLITAHRPSTLDRLGLNWDAMHTRFPSLCHAALVGYASPDAERPGHDLMFQASSGLIAPPHMPRTVVADLAAAEELVSAAMALLFDRANSGSAGYAQVAIEKAAGWFALPAEFGLTLDGPLSGALPTYGLYRAREGYVALAALERHFLQNLTDALGLPKATREALEDIFATRTADEWETWALERDIPLAAVRLPSECETR